MNNERSSLLLESEDIIMAGMGCQRCHGSKSISAFASVSVCECPSRRITREKIAAIKERYQRWLEAGIKNMEVSKEDLEALIDFCEEELDNRENE
jgi:hypothetical protein